MVEIYTEVTAVLSSSVIAAISGCVEETLKKYVRMASVVKVRLDNDVQYSLSGTLESIIAAQEELQNLLGQSDKKNILVMHNGIGETEGVKITELQNGSLAPENTSIVDSDANCDMTKDDFEKRQVENFDDIPQKIRSSFKKLRFFIRERSRSRTRGSLRTCTSLIKNMSITSDADQDDSDVLAQDLEQMKLSTETSSDGDSRLTGDPSLDDKTQLKVDKEGESSVIFKYLCSICSFKTQRSSHFEKHLAIHDKVSTLFKCSHCPFTSLRLSHLRRHEVTHSATVHTCAECSYQTDDVKFLLRHIRLKHNRGIHMEKFSRILNCPHCSYQTTKQYCFERHLRMHCSKERRSLHQCEKCSYKTHRKEHYIRHVNNVHKNKRPYLCHLCGKAFKRGDALQQHHQTHTETKVSAGTNFKCEICEKNFRSQSYLWEHRAVHSEARLFLCEICGASFKTRSVQRKHVATIHRNPRAYSCHSCSKRFNTLFALKRHQKVHVDKPPVEKDEVQITEVNPSESCQVSESVPIESMPDEQQQHVESLNMNLCPPPVPILDLDSVCEETLSAVDVSAALQIPEIVGPTSDIIQQIAPAFFQPSENATALLYLTNGLVQF